MEIIEKSLYENEKILWKNTRYEKEYVLPIFLMGMIALIFGNIAFIFLSINMVYYYLVFVGLIVVLNVAIIPIIVPQFIKELKEKKKGKLSWKDLNKYQKITILTNKRWIQKDFRFLNLDYGKYSKNGIQFHRDIVFINLNLIKFIEVHEWRAWRKSDYTYSISLHFSYNKKEPEGIQLWTLLHSTHSTPKYEEFLKSIKKILQIKNEEYYEVNKSTKYYYFYF